VLQFGHGGGAVEDWVPAGGLGGATAGFNSATAVEPWRTTLWAISLYCGAGCFNSATAVEPWRTPILLPQTGTPPPLQFGHGGGAVEDDAIHAEASADDALQFGHGGGAVEDAAGLDRTVHGEVASIRPRRWSRGGHAFWVLAAYHRGASIRPRRWSRGGPRRLPPWQPPLQVASIRPRRWSRGGPCPRRQRAQLIDDFNSATAVEPWRTAMIDEELARIKQLQFGHGGGAVEDVEAALRTNEAGRTSIRPRRWSRGGPGPWSGRWRRRRHFNSATAVEPWRTRRQALHPGGVGRTSIRPRRWSRGGPRWRASCAASPANFNSATAVEPWRTWPSPSSPRTAGAHFNSATAVEPWRTRIQGRRGSRTQGTSIRPRRWSRGGRRLGPGRRPRRSHFNSATAVEPWRTCGLGPLVVPCKSNFNSATAVEPWRTSATRWAAGRSAGDFNSATAVEPWRTKSSS